MVSTSCMGEPGRQERLFGVWGDIYNDNHAFNDSEVEAPLAIHASLPFVFSLVVLLGVQARMEQVPLQKFHFLPECLSYCGRGILYGIQRRLGIVDPHRERLVFLAAALFFSSTFMEAIISSAVSKGPYVRPL